MPRVTVVPADKLVIVDGEALSFPYSAPEGLHALQWNGESGHTEWAGGPNQSLADGDYDEQVAPYVALWHAEKTRLVTEAEAAEAARLAEYNSTAARFERLRAERDRRIAATDYLIMADYPVDDDTKAKVSAYRQELRDLPAQEGAPWDGGAEKTPWPSLPEVVTG